MLLYDSAVSGNCCKVRQLLDPTGHRVRATRGGRRQTRGPPRAAGRAQPGAAGPDARARRRPLAGRVRSDPLLPRRGHALPARGPISARPGPAVAVLRAVLARAVHRRRPLLGGLLGDTSRRRRRSRPAAQGGYLALGRDGAPPRAAAASSSASSYTIADIALYAYTHVAHEGGFDLSAYPAIGPGCERVAAQPGHIPISA